MYYEYPSKNLRGADPRIHFVAKFRPPTMPSWYRPRAAKLTYLLIYWDVYIIRKPMESMWSTLIDILYIHDHDIHDDCQMKQYLKKTSGTPLCNKKTAINTPCGRIQQDIIMNILHPNKVLSSNKTLALDFMDISLGQPLLDLVPTNYLSRSSIHFNFFRTTDDRGKHRQEN